MANTIIDRRKNPGSKSSDNRQKFIKRTNKEIRKSIHETLGKLTRCGYHSKGY